MANQIQIRRDTAANWTAANPILAQGERGLETDGLGTATVKEKIGDGVKAWNDLPYQESGGGVEAVSGDGVDNTDPDNPVLSFPNPSDIGLGNVDNTSDADKPISDDTQTALDNKADQSDLTNLDSRVSNNENDISNAQSDISTLQTEVGNKADQTDLDSLDTRVTTNENDISNAQNDISSLQTDVSNKADQIALDNHVNDTNNPHNTNASDVGLGNVDNTSDADKPISNATQTALDGKIDSVPVATDSVLGGIYFKDDSASSTLTISTSPII